MTLAQIYDLTRLSPDRILNVDVISLHTFLTYEPVCPSMLKLPPNANELLHWCKAIKTTTKGVAKFALKSATVKRGPRAATAKHDPKAVMSKRALKACGPIGDHWKAGDVESATDHNNDEFKGSSLHLFGFHHDEADSFIANKQHGHLVGMVMRIVIEQKRKVADPSADGYEIAWECTS